MDRRGFLGSILAACAAPAIVRADSLMRIVPMETVILRPSLDHSAQIRRRLAELKADMEFAITQNSKHWRWQGVLTA